MSASLDGTARIWDAATGQQLAALEGHEDGLIGATFSPDGLKILTHSLDQTARIWDSRTGKLQSSLEGHTQAVTTAKFSPDGKLIVTAAGAPLLWLTSIEISLHLKKKELRPDEQAEGSGRSEPAHPSKKKKPQIQDNSPRVWETETGRPVAELKGHQLQVFEAAWSPDSRSIATASDDNSAAIWDATTGRLRAELSGHSNSVTGAEFTPDGKRLLTTSTDDSFRLWDVNSGALIAQLGEQKIRERGRNYRTIPPTGKLSRDGTRILTTTYDVTARIWDATSGHPIAELGGEAGNVIDVAIHPGGAIVATANSDGIVSLWPVAPSTDDLIAQAVSTVPRCLSATQRAEILIDQRFPDWCADPGKYPNGRLRYGMGFDAVKMEQAAALGLPDSRGTLVSWTVAGLPAEAAGVRSGDVIVAVDGKAVEDMRAVLQLINASPVGTAVKLTVVRSKGERTEIVVTGRDPNQPADRRLRDEEDAGSVLEHARKLGELLPDLDVTNTEHAGRFLEQTIPILQRATVLRRAQPMWHRFLVLSYVRARSVGNKGYRFAAAEALPRRAVGAAEGWRRTALENSRASRTLALFLYELADTGEDEMVNLTRARELLLELEKAGKREDEFRGLLNLVNEDLKTLPGMRKRAEKAYEVKNYAEAARWTRERAIAIEAIETAAQGTPGKQTAEALGLLAWYDVLAGDFKPCLGAADRAVALQPDNLMIQMNRAHCLLYLDRVDEARTIYMSHKDKPAEWLDNKSWQAVVAEDFGELRAAGRPHPALAEIGLALGVLP